MRYAIVSDIHANWQAWSAVRDDILERGVDTIVCLGDIVGYGPSPTRVFSDLLNCCDNFVLGNHDAAAAGLLDRSIFNENARRSADWTAAQFDPASLAQLGSAPLVLEDEEILFVHAETPAPDEFGYVETIEDARACFAATDKRFTFIGHTHRPTVFALASDGSMTESADTVVRAREDVRYLVNVGSVGDPGDGTAKACYCLFDSETGEISLHKVSFDTAAFQRELEKVPDLSMPWFLQRHAGEAVRPSHDQAVKSGNVAGTKIKVASSRARIRVQASALATHAGETLRAAKKTPEKPVKMPRKKTVLLPVILIVLAAAGAMTGIYLASHKRPGQTVKVAKKKIPVKAAAPATPRASPVEPAGSAAAVMPAFRAIASREQTGDGKTNTADMAVDGNPETRWCSGDNLTGHWIQVDLGRTLELSGAKIMWECPGLEYGYEIEGSVNAKTWNKLGSGTGNAGDVIPFVTRCNYVRVFVTKLPEGKWASIADIVFIDEKGHQIKNTQPVVTVAKSDTPEKPPAAAASPHVEGVDPVGNVGEAMDYALVYDMDLKKLGPSIKYSVDNAATAPRFDRVAYLIELKKGKQPAQFLWVSMDAFTSDASKLGIPVFSSGIVFQQPVTNLTVVTDVPGVPAGEHVAEGNIEFWPNNYNEKNAAKVPGASDQTYDIGDMRSDAKDGYGSMQVHHTAAKHTLFAINNWRKKGAGDLGIGNSTGKTHDWTFTKNAASYSAGRLRIFVRPMP